jgi:2-polyprenyl-3-methyl-5-hydroxy-6-metoxy-1,4-benzoquinol methylase
MCEPSNAKVIDETSVHFQRFLQCYFSGAGKQDIYTSSDHGYASRTRRAPDNPRRAAKRLLDAKREFSRLFEHMDNLVAPVDAHFQIAGKSVLDFGCGTGALSVAMAIRGGVVTGVDPTMSSLEAATHRAHYFGISHRFVTQLISSAPGLPFPDESFDIVISNSVMEFIPEKRGQYVLEMMRVIKRGGHLIISTENGYFPVDYYSGMVFTIFRRKRAIEKNLPYGLTYFEMLRWVRASNRYTSNLCWANLYNSFDKLATKELSRDRPVKARAIRYANSCFRAVCRLLRLPSDLFLPYATYFFRIDGVRGP